MCVTEVRAFGDHLSIFLSFLSSWLQFLIWQKETLPLLALILLVHPWASNVVKAIPMDNQAVVLHHQMVDHDQVPPWAHCTRIPTMGWTIAAVTLIVTITGTRQWPLRYLYRKEPQLIPISKKPIHSRRRLNKNIECSTPISSRKSYLHTRQASIALWWQKWIDSAFNETVNRSSSSMGLLVTFVQITAVGSTVGSNLPD